ncbi:hypothetical protein QYE76_063332 [Lolium multiflorum]|uniref:CCHC-type domain-containing protein n=1 Tax=Lolium multiflorum TaxID=4521 RepID=A0AAD8W979_LOLMU|nr:hypothetical protein QYE76_063332 [Lolium multiflorum]
MADAQAGKIKVNRENDPLTIALGNPEHPGRVQGKGAIPWKEGFPQDNEPYRYKSRKRKTKRDADRMGRMERELFEVKQMVRELAKVRSEGPHEDHAADVGSQQRRSSVASMEAPAGANAPLAPAGANAPTIDGAPEPRYPVDDVHDSMKECELYQPMRNISWKVAIGTALPCKPGALHHGNPIPAGYARVTVDDVVEGYEDLEIDSAGAVRLGDVKRQIILWQKKDIKFLGSAPRPPTPRNHPTSPPPPVVVVHLHLLHVSRRRPPIHLRWIMAPPSINFNQFLEKEKLKSNGRNFTDWFRHVRIFLTGGSLQYVLDAPLGEPSVDGQQDHRFKKQGKPNKGNFKKGGKKVAAPPEKPKAGPKLETVCYYCQGKGHWKRNCSKYLADLKSGHVKKNGIFDNLAVPEEVHAQPAPIGEEANDDDHEASNEEATKPRRSTRERTTPDWYDPCLNVMIVDNNDEDPATYEEAMMSPDSNKWQEAMKSEMGSMYDNQVWTLVDIPDSRKAVENKWIFKRKTDADGNITVYKARLVAKGFRQIQGVYYDETLSPVAKLKSMRILLAIAAFFDYEIWQMDVKRAFLNGDIEEELHMVQPKGFVDPKNADKVCKLQHSIYGLKQASRSWNLRFDRVIKDFGFIRTHGEACIYKKVSGSSVAFLILYVDDILLIGNDIELLSSVE